MIVRLASRIDRAISLGVLRRDAPSTRAIIRSRNDSPGAAVIWTTISVGQHRGAAGDGGAVAAGLADDRGGLAGDGRLVDGGDALDDVAVAGDDLARPRRPRGRPAAAGCRQPRTPRRRRRSSRRAWVSRAGRAQGVGLGLAAALGDGLGEVAEEHREPEPDRDDDQANDARVDDRQ